MKVFSLVLALSAEANSPWPVEECQADKAEFRENFTEINDRNPCCGSYKISFKRFKEIPRFVRE